MLADGPWTIGRFALEPPEIVEAAKWIAFARLLRESATQDLDEVTESLNDASRDLAAKTQSAQENLKRSRIARARIRLAEAYKHRREVRNLLLLDEDIHGKS